MCETIELKCGARWRTLHRAGTKDLAAGEMVVVCPKCHMAFVVQDRDGELTVSM